MFVYQSNPTLHFLMSINDAVFTIPIYFHDQFQSISIMICSCHGCDQPGTNGCASCRLVGYCSRPCQTADWRRHKEECPGHLGKMGMVNLEKAREFQQERNFVQALRYAELALTKLKQLKDRPLAVIELLHNALECKFHALASLTRYQDNLECATEWYNLWATTYRRNLRSIEVSFQLIGSLICNKEFVLAHLIAGTVYEMTTHPLTNDIPKNHQ